VLCIILCFALGIANIFHLHLVILFSIICMFVISHMGPLAILESPLMARQNLFLPTSLHRNSSPPPHLPNIIQFDAFIRRFTTNYMRAAVYLTMSVIQWLSILAAKTSDCCGRRANRCNFYALAGVKGQGFVGSKTLGGQGLRR
jgi:hypothetical protein